MIRRIKNNYHLLQAIAANTLNSFPARQMNFIGVTGTDGKTTTVSLIAHLLRAHDLKVARLSTLGAYIHDKEYDTGFHVTTPNSFMLQRVLRKAVEEHVTHFVLEVTSHALDQHRVWGISYDAGVLTNVTHEHLDYHKTYEQYLRTKLKLLERSRIKIVNRDDASYDAAKKKFTDKKLLSYGLSAHADVNPKTIKIPSSIEGFNIYNCLAAASAASSFGVPVEVIEHALKTFEFPKGRQDLVYKKNFKVLVDFAHTPNSIESLLKTYKKNTSGRVIHIFGSAGERDASKRPLMGEASSAHADVIILTAEDPRHESIDEINAAIEKGISSKFKFESELSSMSKRVFCKINDRQEAITTGIRIAKPGDLVVITGKGHERSMNYGNGEIAWDEHAAVAAALKKRGR